MNQQETNDLIQKFNVATNEAGVRVEAIFGELKAALDAAGSPVTPEQIAEIDAILARLDSIGKKPTDPVPVEPEPTF